MYGLLSHIDITSLQAEISCMGYCCTLIEHHASLDIVTKPALLIYLSSLVWSLYRCALESLMFSYMGAGFSGPPGRPSVCSPWKPNH